MNLSAPARSQAPLAAMEPSKHKAQSFQAAMIDAWKALADVELLQDLCGAIESITNDSQRCSTPKGKGLRCSTLLGAPLDLRGQDFAILVVLGLALSEAWGCRVLME